MDFYGSEFGFVVDSFRDFCRDCNQASKRSQFLLLKPKVDIGSKKLKASFSLKTIKTSFEISNRQIRLFFCNLGFAKTDVAFYVLKIIHLKSFPTKSWNFTVISFFPQNLSTLTNAKISTSTRYYVSKNCDRVESKSDV